MAVNPMMESVMSAGIHGMNVALTGAKSAAMEVAQLNGTSSTSRTGGASPAPSGGEIESLTEALSSLKLYERQVQASAKVVKTADELIGFLLDVHA